MKIALVVQGRFHAFELARALIERGHATAVFTNYPGWATEGFGLPARYVRSFVLHGVLSRAVAKLRGLRLDRPIGEALLHRLFGHWATRALGREPWDLIYCFSGVAEELLRAPRLAGSRRLLARGSAHIRVQDELLAAEERRTGVKVERPSPWMIAREEREYALADQIVVLSSFALASFRSRGVAQNRLAMLPLGVDTALFRPSEAVIEARCRRILSGEPLRVLYTGNLSLQKGMWDLAIVLRELHSAPFRFRLVGATAPEIMTLLPELSRGAAMIPKLRQSELPHEYAAADLYLLPTIQDGFAAVLCQAQANALPIITTTNSAGPDLLREGETGWIVPIRAPEVIAERLRWCDAHRSELAQIVRQSYARFHARDWSAVAAQFEQIAAGDPALIH